MQISVFFATWQQLNELLHRVLDLLSVLSLGKQLQRCRHKPWRQDTVSSLWGFILSWYIQNNNILSMSQCIYEWLNTKGALQWQMNFEKQAFYRKSGEHALTKHCFSMKPKCHCYGTPIRTVFDVRNSSWVQSIKDYIRILCCCLFEVVNHSPVIIRLVVTKSKNNISNTGKHGGLY